jgi:hypothetical protein
VTRKRSPSASTNGTRRPEREVTVTLTVAKPEAVIQLAEALGEAAAEMWLAGKLDLSR